MIPSLTEILTALYGAWRMARLDARGLTYFDDSPEGVWRSFFAAVIVGPAFAVMMIFHFSMLPLGTDPVRFALAEILAYIISWVAYPLLIVSVTQLLRCHEHAFLYICAYNWSLVLQHALWVPVTILTLTGIFPEPLAQLAWLVALGAILVYMWFIARRALDVPGLTAAGIVLLDLLLGLVIRSIANGLH
jgi:hypothetical protein